jgi:hypothetical protein
MAGMPARKPWMVPVGALVVGLAAGVTMMALWHRAAEPVATFDRSADAQLEDGRGRPIPLPGDRGIRRGQKVRAGARTARIALRRGGTLDLGPGGRAAFGGRGEATLEAGLAIIDTRSVLRQVDIETPAGRVVLTTARVELRVALVRPPVEPGGAPAMAFLQVEEGLVRLEAMGRTLPLEEGQAGMLIAGRPPMPRLETEPARAAAPPPPSAEPDPLPAVAVGMALPIPLPISAGAITGVVEMEGTPPVDATRSPVCATAGTPPWSVSEGRVAGVYVHVTSPLPGLVPPPPPAVEVAQSGCAVVPRVAAALVGQRVVLGTADGAAHEVRVTRDGAVLADTRPGGAWTATHEGIFTLRCNLHPEATGVLAVSPHPLFAVTGSDGRFAIAGVPPGRHTLTAWHERGGEKSQEVTVTVGRTSEVRFSYAGDPGVAITSPTPLATAASAPPAGATAILASAPALAGAPVAALATASPPTSAGSEGAPEHREVEPCQIAVAGSSPVARACSEGGLPRAYAVMDQIVTAARARGARVRCQGCHADPESYALRSGARTRLDRLLAAPAVVTSYIVTPRPATLRVPAKRR